MVKKTSKILETEAPLADRCTITGSRRIDPHPRGELTRRDLLRRASLLTGSALFLPTMAQMFGARSAYAQAQCTATTTGAMPFLVIDMDGGASLPGNFLVRKGADASEMLSSYSLLGWNPRASGALDTQFGLPMAAQSSMILSGILQTTSPEARARVRMGGFAHFGFDDTSRNPHNALTLIAKAGARGSLIDVGLGTAESASGGKSEPTYVDASLKPVFISRERGLNDLSGAIKFGEAFDTLDRRVVEAVGTGAMNLSRGQLDKYREIEGGDEFAALSECAYEKTTTFTQGTSAVNPRSDATMQGIYQINDQTAPNAEAVIEATVVMNAVKGLSGPGCIVIPGCDYHTSTQSDGDGRDLAAGLALGRAIETAHQLGRPLFFQILTDGGVGSQPNSRIWSDEAGDKSMTVIGYYNPNGPATLVREQVGAYTDGQSADRTTFIGADASKIGYAVLANYLAVNGQMARLRDILAEVTGTPDAFSEQQIQSMMIFAES